MRGGVGPVRPLPDSRAHELFEECVRYAPSDIAAVHRGTRWTYVDLDATANRVAGTLLAAGLRPEGVVAVISQRTLDWLAAILGIFKAGGVYLPIDPSYPDKRITSAHAVAIRHSVVVLCRPLDEIGRNEDFFAHGGNSLPGVLLVMLLGGLVPLLQALSVPENPAVALVCVPYEAGNALNFGTMAQTLSTSDVAMYAVELPGHDVARPGNRLAGLDRLASRLSQEILDRITVPVALSGHGAGVALARATGRSLQAANVRPRHLFLAAATEQEPATTVGSAGISAWLRDSGAIVDMDQWRSVRGELIERAYRHDLGEAERFLGACTETVDLPATIIAVPRAPGEGDAAARCTAVLPSARTIRFTGAGRYLLRRHAAADLVAATIAATEGGTH